MCIVGIGIVTFWIDVELVLQLKSWVAHNSYIHVIISDFMILSIRELDNWLTLQFTNSLIDFGSV